MELFQKTKRSPLYTVSAIKAYAMKFVRGFSLCDEKEKIFQKSLVTPHKGHSCPVTRLYGQENWIPYPSNYFAAKR